MKPSDTYKLLVDSVGQWDFTGDFVPGELLLTGDAAFPVLVSPEKQVVIAVSQYGKGRMVVVSHEEILKNPNFSQFLRNAVDWLRPSPEAQVGVHRSLDPLSQLLLGSSTKVQPGVGLSASLGVYCTHAYGDAQAEELVQFVKGGGGLLIGGQAWSWASQHDAEKVLFEFPGNQVTSVAGVYFTGNTVGTGIFKVSRKIPKIPLIVLHGANLSHDVELLLHGVSELDIVTGGVPSPLLVHGLLAFPLGLDSSHRCFLAAAHYGRGRVVVASHEGQLCAPKLAGFLLNAVHWLDAGRQGLVGVAAHLKGLCSLLSQEERRYRVSELTSDMSVYCCPSHSDREAEKLHTFVAEGGGLLIGGQAWYWASQNQGRAAIAGYPGNKILNRFGISILGTNIKADKYPVLLPGEPAHHYHFRQALSLFQRHVDKEEALRAPLADWLQRLGQDCSAFLRIPAEDCPAYSSLHRMLLKVLRRGGIPQVSKKNPVKSNSKEAALLCLATQLSQTMTDCAVLVQKPADGVCTLPCTPPVTLEIDGTNAGGTAWMSTGLYLPDGNTAVITFPCMVTSAGLQVQIGCHSDDLTAAKELKRAPMVIHKCHVSCQKQSVSCLWGGLIYIIVPGGSQLGKVPITVEGAVKVPYFRLGETCKCQWLASIRHYPAPWAELATENIILTVPADSIRHIENPEPLLTLWDQIMLAIADLAAAPAKFPRPERIVTDVQISAGWMHAGYPIMGHLDSVKEMVTVEHMRATGLWGPIHELGHNQQRAGWEFPPHTTEATCNLWSVYVHEKVLGIPRDRAHQALQPRCRKERITSYLEKGAQLKDWSVWTALETYLQLQEGFGWEPFTLLFSDYQKMCNIPKDNPSKMNLWAEKFSRQDSDLIRDRSIKRQIKVALATELDSFHEERSGSPQTSASSASESTIPNSPPQKRRRTAEGESSQSHVEASEYLDGDDGTRFHIHTRDEIKICDRFLLGDCTQGDSCPLHHTRYPYHWQIRRGDSKAWQSVSESAQRHLEKLYCDTGKEQIKFMDKGGAAGSIFLHSMKLVCFGPYDKVRRLSNTCDPKENPHFPTDWTVYWKSNGNWKKYEEPISQGLLAAYEQDKDSYTFEHQGHIFIVDLKRRVQRNQDKGCIRLLQRRPSYRPLLSMVPHLMTLPRRPWGIVPSVSDVLGENPKDGYCGSYPAAWVPKPPDDQAFLKMEVVPTEVAYHRVCSLFHQSLSEEKTLVLGIYRIRNDDLWEKYTRQKTIMSHACSLQEKRQLEKHLFYGSAADFLEPICQKNFDPDFSRLHAPIYGRGCYFSRSAVYSHRHGQASKAGLRYMFLAKVLVGKTAVGNKLFRHPLPVMPGGQLCNSWVNSKSSTKVYVIFDNCQCYPYFLISYKMLSDPVAVDG